MFCIQVVILPESYFHIILKSLRLKYFLCLYTVYVVYDTKVHSSDCKLLYHYFYIFWCLIAILLHQLFVYNMM